MLRFVKCTLIIRSNILNQSYMLSGYHTTGVLKSDSTKYEHNIRQEKSAYQSVADFYAGKSVFLTGGTGFLGKVFIEKLLSHCSELDKIYVLIRGRKGASAEKRLEQLLETPVFTKLRNQKPEFLDKVVAIAGDITEPKLGINSEDEKTLIDKVSVVFHSAAIVKFTEPFENLINANVEGTRKVMNLGKQMKNLEIFVHISTAFSNTDKLIIDEIVYPSFKNLEDVYYFMRNHSKDEQEIKKYIGGHANTYAFSKSLAETLVFETYGNMPTIIVRPSTVSPVFHEPMPGWVDSWVAGTALFTDVARGLTRIMYGNKDVVMDMIPVDYVCNLTIVAAAKSPKTKELAVYNCCTSSTNPITWKGAADLFAKDSNKFGYRDLPWPKVFVSESPLVISVVTLFCQTAPAFVIDLWLRATGKKPKYLKTQLRANLLRDLLKPFTTGSFLMNSDRSQKLASSLDANDSKQFICDTKTIDWKKYMPIYCYGVKQYLLSEKLRTCARGLLETTCCGSTQGQVLLALDLDDAMYVRVIWFNLKDRIFFILRKIL